MSAEDTIRILLTHSLYSEEPLDREEWRRVAARVAWSRETLDAWYAAMEHRDEVCTEAVERLSEEDFNRLFDAEEAKVAALRAQIDAVIQRDEWPRHLYTGGL